jgi:hypothetical protein
MKAERQVDWNFVKNFFRERSLTAEFCPQITQNVWRWRCAPISARRADATFFCVVCVICGQKEFPRASQN